MNPQTIHGHCDAAWAPLRDTLCTLLEQAGPQGCALAVARDGELVVDLWSGAADRAGDRPWQRDSVVNVFSASKGVLALAMAQLVDAGELDVEKPVAHYWSEFRQGDKRDVSVAQVLDHSAGMIGFHSPVPEHEVYDWQAITTRIARETPWWAPGSQLGYSPFLYGWILGEVLQRITGMLPGEFLRRELCGPLGADFLLGVRDEELARVADLGPWQHADAKPTGDNLLSLTRAHETSRAAFTNPPSLMAGTNSLAWRQAQIPAAGGHANARGLATLYGALAAEGQWQGRRLLSNATRGGFSRGRVSANCQVLHADLAFGLGFMLPSEEVSFGPGANSFGHPGAGGAIGFADPDRRLGFGFVSNKLGQHLLIDPRARRLIDATYALLQQQS